ncbi:MAG: para-aminobenzoate synthetase component 1 [Paraglaciecola sp.]|jgi:para-aminobenzoate synthetase component 1
MKQKIHVPISIVQLDIATQLELADLFQHFATQSWAMLLDSSASDHQDGRYDIMVAQPIATIQTHGELSTIWRQSADNTIVSSENPLSLLQNLLDQTLPEDKQNTPADFSLPFVIGALGYFGYDLGRRFESLPAPQQESYLSADMSVGIYNWSIIKDNYRESFYLCAQDPDSAPSVEYLQNIALEIPAPQPTFSLLSDWQQNMLQHDYQAKIAQIMAYLRAGDCYQVNLAQRFCADYEGDEWQAYQILRRANKAPFSAFLRLPDNVILSISPERFLSVKGDAVQSKPIKGTRPRSLNPAQDRANIEALIHSEKDQAENLMIVDLLRNDLSKNCRPGSVEVPALFQVESFAAVHHLVSTVTGRLNEDCSAIKLLQGAFPGGSITGAPKIRAMQIIDELEPHKRNIYCGSIGYIGINRDMDTSICIRTLLCEQDKLYCWAGGGIVIDSEPEAEYQESLDKVSKILPLLLKQQTQL